MPWCGDYKLDMDIAFASFVMLSSKLSLLLLQKWGIYCFKHDQVCVKDSSISQGLLFYTINKMD